MLVTSVLTLSAAGGIALIGNRVRRQWFARPLVAQLTSSQLAQPGTTTDIVQQHDQPILSTDQHLALAAGLLGATTIASLGLPLLSIVSLPGILYLDVFFVRRAYRHWQETHSFGIAINDAVLATGLLVTGQFSAGALFAALFFTGRKLEEKGAASMLADETPTDSTPSAAPPALPSNEEPAQWQIWVNRGSVPLLALSMASIPFLGFARALGVLVANFGYDYRVLAPLGTLSHLRAAQHEGLWLRDAHVFERLQQTTVLLVDGNCVCASGVLNNAFLSSHLTIERAADDPVATAAQITTWQNAGHTVAYISAAPEDTAAFNQADVLITYTDGVADQPDIDESIHVLLQSDQPEHLVDLFVLTAALKGSRKRGLVLALIPSLINLSGIYFWHFNPVIALLIDYTGMSAGVLNASVPWRPRHE